MNIPYRQLLTNKKYQVIICGLTGGSVTALHQTDFSIAGGNDFSTAGEALRDVPIIGQALALKDKATNLIRLTGRSVTTQFETRLAWSNSLKPSFQVEMSFYEDSIKNTDTVLDKYLRIKSAVLPSAKGEFFLAPLGYKIASVNSKNTKASSLKPQGVLSIEIGEWFRGTNLVMTAESFTFSKEVNKNGKPIFASGSITLEPFKAVTFKEFKDYFINV